MNRPLNTALLRQMAREDAPLLLAFVGTWIWAAISWPADGPPSLPLALVILVFPAIAWTNWARMPLTDPRGSDLLARTSSHRAIRTFAGVFLLVVVGLFIHHDLSYRAMIEAGWLFPLAGLAFIQFGNVLPRLPYNTSAGWRTRWNVDDESNWYRTQRVAGRSMMVFGLAQIALTPMRQMIPDDSPALLITWWALLLATMSVPYLASYRWSLERTSTN